MAKQTRVSLSRSQNLDFSRLFLTFIPKKYPTGCAVVSVPVQGYPMLLLFQVFYANVSFWWSKSVLFSVIIVPLSALGDAPYPVIILQRTFEACIALTCEIQDKAIRSSGTQLIPAAVSAVIPSPVPMTLISEHACIDHSPSANRLIIAMVTIETRFSTTQPWSLVDKTWFCRFYEV